MNIRDYIKAIGICLMAVGILCLPIGFGASPKRDTSIFFNFADLGIFLKASLIFLTLGLLLLAIAWLIPRQNE